MKKAQERLIDFWREHKRMPSYSEIAKICGYKSKNSAFKFIKKNISEGLVSKDALGKLSPGSKLLGLPALGLVEAGFPSSAEEIRDFINLDSYLIPRRDATYILKVKGESMRDAGILDGDLVLAERGKEAKAGDVVIARVDNDWTIKYLRRKNNSYFLEPANENFTPIFPEGELVIEAVVIGIVRSYSKK